MNWFKETWWLVKQLFTTLQFKNLDDYIKWLNTMPLADNGNINEIENYNFA